MVKVNYFQSMTCVRLFCLRGIINIGRGSDVSKDQRPSILPVDQK